jgi:hypothetical protein
MRGRGVHSDRAKLAKGDVSRKFWEAAGRQYEVAVNLDPTSGQALNNWALALQQVRAVAPSPIPDGCRRHWWQASLDGCARHAVQAVSCGSLVSIPLFHPPAAPGRYWRKVVPHTNNQPAAALVPAVVSVYLLYSLQLGASLDMRHCI